MKTPREILLQQHQSAVPKLDAVRHEAMARLKQPASVETPSWWSLLQSLRWHLAGLGAAWIVVALLNADRAPNPVATVALEKIPAAQMWAAVRENQRMLREYLETDVVETDPAPNQRSEIKIEERIV